ncbi:MAG: phosphomannomutase/phosphoglucomutase [bacterium]
MNEAIFREYDIRGIAETDLTDEVTNLIGKAFGTYARRQGANTVSVGCDVRLTSPRLKGAMIDGISSTGANVIDIGTVPTPALYYSVFHYGSDGGMMITGSHNPIEYNGFKMNLTSGSVFGEKIQELKGLIERGDFESGSGNLRSENVVPAYQKMLNEKFDFKRNLKIIMDPGNGTAGPLARSFFLGKGMDVECIFCEPDGSFPNHLPDPTVLKYTKALREKVVEQGADIGIGYDGDADRIGVIDNKGRTVFADRLLAIIARDMLSRHPGEQVLFDVKCSQSLEDEIKKYGGKPLMWKTGHAILKSKMKEEKALLAGEMSGHIFFGENYYGFDDAIYASALLVRILSESDNSFAEIVDEIPAFYSTPEVRLECTDQEKFGIVADLVDYFKARYDAIDVDGVRALFGDGWGLVRASNTQPVLVLRMEAQSEERLKEIIKIFVDKLQEYPSVRVDPEEFIIVKG